MPTAWVLRADQRLLGAAQLGRLRQACARELGADMAGLDARRWAALTREVYCAVRARGTTERVDAFNRTYGLMRGLGSAFLVLSAAVVVRDPQTWGWAAVGIAAAALAFCRMVRSGERYGRELLVEFIRLTPVGQTPAPSA